MYYASFSERDISGNRKYKSMCKELSPPIALCLHARRRLQVDACGHLLGHNTKKFCREIYVKNIILQGNVGKYLSTIYLTK